MTLSPELQRILDEALSRGSLIDGHEDLKHKPAESNRDNKFQPIRSFHVPPQPKVDPRSFDAQPEPIRSGYSNPVDSDEFRKLWER